LCTRERTIYSGVRDALHRLLYLNAFVIFDYRSPKSDETSFRRLHIPKLVCGVSIPADEYNQGGHACQRPIKPHGVVVVVRRGVHKQRHRKQ
jgi:rhodanese-related sulfurtransferase